MKGTPFLILLAFIAGAVIGSDFGNIDQPVGEVDYEKPSNSTQDQSVPIGLDEEPINTQVPELLSNAVETRSQQFEQSAGKPKPNTRHHESSDPFLSFQTQLDPSRRRSVRPLSELVGSSQERVQFEATKMLHPELEKLDPLDLYFDDITWPY